MTELDDDGVAGGERGDDFFPAALSNKTCGAAAIHRVVLHGVGVLEKPGESLAPAAFREIEGLVGHGRVAGEIEPRGIGGAGGERAGEQEQGEEEAGRHGKDLR